MAIGHKFRAFWIIGLLRNPYQTLTLWINDMNSPDYSLTLSAPSPPTWSSAWQGIFHGVSIFHGESRVWKGKNKEGRKQPIWERKMLETKHNISGWLIICYSKLAVLLCCKPARKQTNRFFHFLPAERSTSTGFYINPFSSPIKKAKNHTGVSDIERHDLRIKVMDCLGEGSMTALRRSREHNGCPITQSKI